MSKSRQPNTEDEQQNEATGLTKSPVATPVDLKAVLTGSHYILQSEIKRLAIESAKGLLSKDSSAALVNYVKVLTSLIKEEESLADNLTDEELEDIVQGRK
jgi:hypothetical protein